VFLTKRATGRTIYLVRHSAAMDSARVGICKTSLIRHQVLLAQLQKLVDSAKADPANGAGFRDRGATILAESASRDSVAVAGINDVYMRAAIDTAGTGISGHYVFASVPRGDYFVFGEWAIGAKHYRWLAPVKMSSGHIVRRDLDNSVESGAGVYCNIGLGSER